LPARSPTPTLNNVALTIIQSSEGKVIHQKTQVSSLKTFLAEAISTPSWLLALWSVSDFIDTDLGCQIC
jgi:hypothetical protein